MHSPESPPRPPHPSLFPRDWFNLSLIRTGRERYDVGNGDINHAYGVIVQNVTRGGGDTRPLSLYYPRNGVVTEGNVIPWHITARNEVQLTPPRARKGGRDRAISCDTSGRIAERFFGLAASYNVGSTFATPVVAVTQSRRTTIRISRRDSRRSARSIKK